MGNPASNTKDCFREFIGKRMMGVLFNALPVSRADLRSGNKTIVFEDGRGLTISDNGSYWVESKEDVARAIQAKKHELDNVQREIADVIVLSGAV